MRDSAGPAIIGADGPALVLPGRIAVLLLPILRDAQHRLRRDGVTVIPDVVELFEAVEGVARAYAAGRVQAAVAASPAEDDEEWLSTEEAAAVMGCSPRNARALGERGTVPAEKRGGRWWFERRGTEAYADRG